jgi:branched-chain amino acid aminotransferase
MFDMRLNSHSRLSLIIALLEAIEAGCDEALMLDPHGHVSTCNATNFFWVKDGEVFTSRGDYAFNGITRGNIIALAKANALPLKIGDFALERAWAAGEAFVTGTLGGVTPVRWIDGHEMSASPGPVTRRLAGLYDDLKDAEAA